MKITVGQLRQLIRELKKRRPDGFLPSDDESRYLDKPFSAGGWPEGDYDPPVNVQISKYLKSMGLLGRD